MSAMKKHTGITTIELLVCISVLAILSTVGVPSFRWFIASQHQDATVVRLTDTLRQSRIEALRLKQYVSVCATINGTSCSGQSDWSKGWIAYVDNNRNNTKDNGETVLFAQTESQSTVNTTASGSSLRFFPNGLMESGSFAICSSTLSQKNTIAVNASGYISYAQTHC
ncbi:MAG: GspH/FimT family pseudopilin [Aeromonadaceae bacterium]|nr:GspH/FimT family pseudopilin [Aeromonadaceae bacterium]